ncbi:MAG TPA: sigma-70 family RNA polymerase sigma factor [candidate division Zixibacteria bacterium]|nr:sigma-70 family RNA polymerase sigma factor [candidate division Zixibacteria bacterium]
MTDNIHEIWDLVLQGNHAAWQKLVATYSPLVFSIAVRVGLETADAEDCAQYTWLALYRRRFTIKDPVSLPAWLIRTTHRRAIYIAQRLRPIRSDSEQDRTPSPRLPDEIVQQLEYEAVVGQAMRQMDSRCQRLIRALYLGATQVSYNQLARSLGVNINSIGSLRSRCLNKLRRILKIMGFEWD